MKKSSTGLFYIRKDKVFKWQNLIEEEEVVKMVGMIVCLSLEVESSRDRKAFKNDFRPSDTKFKMASEIACLIRLIHLTVDSILVISHINHLHRCS